MTTEENQVEATEIDVNDNDSNELTKEIESIKNQIENGDAEEPNDDNADNNSEEEPDEEKELTEKEEIALLKQEIAEVKAQNNGRNIHIKDQKAIIVAKNAEIAEIKAEMEKYRTTDDDHLDSPKESIRKDKYVEQLQDQFNQKQHELTVEQATQTFYERFDDFENNTEEFAEVFQEHCKKNNILVKDSDLALIKTDTRGEVKKFIESGADMAILNGWARKAERKALLNSTKKELGLLKTEDRSQKRKNADGYKSSTAQGNASNLDPLEVDISSMNSTERKTFIAKAQQQLQKQE